MSTYTALARHLCVGDKVLYDGPATIAWISPGDYPTDPITIEFSRPGGQRSRRIVPPHSLFTVVVPPAGATR